MATSPTQHLGDVEKGGTGDGGQDVAMKNATTSGSELHSAPSSPPSKMQAYIDRIEQFAGIEARGIRRVETHEKHRVGRMGYVQIVLLWVSINLAANNITLGMLGPSLFGLSFIDASLCATFGATLGSLPTAYTATWGPVSGNRTMIFARYTMGWWPSKLIALLNLIVLLGYCLIDCVVAGQILSAVSTGGNMSVVVVAVITWVVTTFGISIFHLYERYAFLPQVIVLCILFGTAGKYFDTTTATQGDSRTIAGSRLSFFSICLSAAITYAGGAADYFVYYPETTPPWIVFTCSMIGLTLSFTFALVLGAGLASGTVTKPEWESAYGVSQGALIVVGYGPLGGFGKFCSVVVALGLIANLIAPTYSSGVDFQILGRYAAKIPRLIWNTFGVIIYTVCALAGRNSLSAIFTNFLALMGYWVAIWIAITLEEQLIFRRRRGYDWNAWNDRSKLPLGIAALVAFLIGWVGAILCMAQAWYTGPIARSVGEHGADVSDLSLEFSSILADLSHSDG
ncbi:MAG: hypothetical protein M1812_006738 [Candelaria pacifica]|nr:MAG: hypothetical protein M1812_006738 [Candelaria pacifica]